MSTMLMTTAGTRPMPDLWRRWRRVLLAAGLLALPAAAGAAPACEAIDFDGAAFTACTVDLGRDTLRLWLDDPAGTPWGQFSRLGDALARDGADLTLAMNGGMYHPDRSPVGLYVEDGVELAPLVTSAGPGNFGMLPNGVLCLSPGRAQVIETRTYAADRPACDWATQSGPMLVQGGALHPRFIPDSPSLYVRNGIGVTPAGDRAVLAISDQPVNFHHFARLFRDRLGLRDALYLDGSVSRLWAPGAGRRDIGFAVGPILGIARPGG